MSKLTDIEILKRAEAILANTIQKEDALTSPEATRKFLQIKLHKQEREIFAVLFLDSQHRVISYEELFHGTIDAASVYPREVLKAALAHNAAAVIFAHNHPSGMAEPSQADKRITDRLVEGLKLVDIRVLDHFVFGDGEFVSFAERGLI